MSETTAEEHECEYKLIMEAQNSNMKRLIADLEQAEAHLGEAVELLREVEPVLYVSTKGSPYDHIHTFLAGLEKRG